MARKRRRQPLPDAPTVSGHLYIKIKPESTRFFRYLLEAYDNLAYTSVVNRKTCILKLIYSPLQEKEFFAALQEIQQSILVEVLPINRALHPDVENYL